MGRPGIVIVVRAAVRGVQQPFSGSSGSSHDTVLVIVGVTATTWGNARGLQR